MWLKILKVVADIALPWIMNSINKKKAKRLEKVVEVVTTGVEVAERIKELRKDSDLTDKEKVKLVKNVVKDFAVESGVQEILAKKVEVFKDKVKAG